MSQARGMLLLAAGIVIGLVLAATSIEPAQTVSAASSEGASSALVSVVSTVSAAPPSPVAALEDRDVYYPGSETLGPNEMRVVACGKCS